LLVDATELPLEVGELVLLYQKKAGSELGEAAAYVEVVVRCNQRCKAGVAAGIVFDYVR
jgi:hypothetical protein